MNGFRFSLALMLAATSYVAMVCMAVIHAPHGWDTAVFSFTLLVLLIAVVAAAIRRGQSRGEWIGFAIVGWGYFLVAFGPFGNADRLVATPLAERLWVLIAAPIEYEDVPLKSRLMEYRDISGNPMAPSFKELSVVCHSVFTLAVAVAGALIARYFAATQGRDPEASVTGAEGRVMTR